MLNISLVHSFLDFAKGIKIFTLQFLGSSPTHRKHHTLDSSSYPGDSRKTSDSDLSPPRHKQSSGPQDSDSDLSPPRNRPRHRSSDSDLSPPRRKQRAKSSDSDLSPPRRSQPLGKKVRTFRSPVLVQSNSFSSSVQVSEIKPEKSSSQDLQSSYLLSEGKTI